MHLVALDRTGVLEKKKRQKIKIANKVRYNVIFLKKLFAPILIGIKTFTANIYL